MIRTLTFAGLAAGAMLLATMPLTAQNGGAAQAATAMTGQEETYDLLFRNGTLDGITAPLTYEREVTNSADADAAERDTGEIRVAFEGDEEAETPRKAVLSFHQGDRFRSMGSFPASVGNPIIMVFVESVIRDMAATAGGSPFYIRNRVKDALVQPAETEEVTVSLDGRDVAARAVTLRPFKDDPNAERMQGFADLALTVTMSDEVPGWYHSLSARIDAKGDPSLNYASVMRYSVGGATR